MYLPCEVNEIVNSQGPISKRTTISVDALVYQRLKSQGQFGESFSELLARILEEVDSKRNVGDN